MKSSTDKSKLKQLGLSLLMAGGMLSCAPAAWASLTLDSVRYVFTGDKPSLAITITNPDERVFGGQVWVDNIVEQDTRPSFVVTPSFFKVKGRGSQSLRVIKAADHMPQDKESVYWLNLQDIPPALKESGLAIALRTRVKMFYRPEALVKGRPDAEANIKIERRPGAQVLVNPTPYIFAINGLLDDKGAPQKLGDTTAEKLLMFMPGDAVDITGLNVSQVVAVNDYAAVKTYTIKRAGGV